MIAFLAKEIVWNTLISTIKGKFMIFPGYDLLTEDSTLFTGVRERSRRLPCLPDEERPIGCLACQKERSGSVSISSSCHLLLFISPSKEPLKCRQDEIYLNQSLSESCTNERRGPVASSESDTAVHHTTLKYLMLSRPATGSKFTRSS